MTAPDNKEPRLSANLVEAGGGEATTGVLSTALSAVCFYAAFTFCSGTEQLLLASIGGLLASGGLR